MKSGEPDETREVPDWKYLEILCSTEETHVCLNPHSIQFFHEMSLIVNYI